MMCARRGAMAAGPLWWPAMAVPLRCPLPQSWITLLEGEADPERMRRPDRDSTLAHLHRVTVPRPRWEGSTFLPLIIATNFQNWRTGWGRSAAGFRCLRNCLSRPWPWWSGKADYAGNLGILADETYGQDALNAATGRGWWIGRPVELPGSNPLQFEHGRSIGTNLISWPQEHVAKCLVFYDPDDAEAHRLEQEAQVRALYEATQASGHDCSWRSFRPRIAPKPTPSTAP